MVDTSSSCKGNLEILSAAVFTALVQTSPLASVVVASSWTKPHKLILAEAKTLPKASDNYGTFISLHLNKTMRLCLKLPVGGVRECVGGHSEGKKRRDTKQREKVRGRRTG